MNPELQRRIAQKGGASVPARERSFSKNRTLAAEAGRKGGLVSRKAAQQKSEAPKPQADFGGDGLGSK